MTAIEEAGGFRHHLDGVPIHAGELLECYDADQNTWPSVRFELLFGQRGREAIIVFPDGRTLPIEDRTPLRWPTAR